MGAGNWIPNHAWNGAYEMVYVYWPTFEDEEEEMLVFEMEWWWNDLRNDIQNLLPPSFQSINFTQRQYREPETIVAENELLEVSIKDWNSYVAIQVYIPDDEIYEDRDLSLRNLAGHHLPKVAKRLFDGLEENGYELHIRTSAWTSCRRGFVRMPA